VFSNGCAIDIGASTSLTISQPAGQQGGYCVQTAQSGDVVSTVAQSAPSGEIVGTVSQGATGFSKTQLIGIIAGGAAFGVGIAIIAASN
ncbi:MAG: hypothetical protein AAFO77_13980, partial [Pseudomonadota bacterium]